MTIGEMRPCGVTYLPSDLQRRYRTILDEARAGEARVRDLDGTTLLLIPEAEVRALRRVNGAAANLAHDRAGRRAPGDPNAGGARVWRVELLRVFDADDLLEFTREIREAIIRCRA